MLIDTVMVAGIALWSLALYLCLSTWREWLMDKLNRWQDNLGASLISILPFLALGGICNFAVEFSLGRSWSISMGIMACFAFGIYELGRRSTYFSPED